MVICDAQFEYDWKVQFRNGHILLLNHILVFN